MRAGAPATSIIQRLRFDDAVDAAADADDSAARTHLPGFLTHPSSRTPSSMAWRSATARCGSAVQVRRDGGRLDVAVASTGEARLPASFARRPHRGRQLDRSSASSGSATTASASSFAAASRS